jgi:hypothetical protein
MNKYVGEMTTIGRRNTTRLGSLHSTLRQSDLWRRERYSHFADPISVWSIREMYLIRYCDLDLLSTLVGILLLQRGA